MHTVKRKHTVGVQVGCSGIHSKESDIQVGSFSGSYTRFKSTNVSKSYILRYDELLYRYLNDRQQLIFWLPGFGLISRKRSCVICGSIMKLAEAGDRSDGFKWECRKSVNGKKRRSECSIRKDSLFDEKSNLSLYVVMKFTYWWSHKLNQCQIKTQLGLSSSTAVDWDMSCREVCEIVTVAEGELLGGPGKNVQIDESKIGKWKYHHSHRGQWVFGGIEENSRKSFMFTVNQRDEDTLLPIIKQDASEAIISTQLSV